MLSSLKLSFPDETGAFTSRLRAASLIDGLSDDERIYLGDYDRPAMTVVKPDTGKPEETKEMRRAKRRKISAHVDELMAQERMRVLAERAERRAENDRLKAEQEQRRQKAREAREQRRLNPPSRFDEDEEIELKPLEPRWFVPVIGKPNREGKIPVLLEPKTTILVDPKKDIQAVISRYQRILNLKSE